MIPPEQVKEAVSEEHRQLLDHGPPVLRRLFPRGLDTDYDVAERRPGELGKIALAERERENIGGPIFSPIRSVQFMDCFVVS
jgi:hypothetical protein